MYTIYKIVKAECNGGSHLSVLAIICPNYKHVHYISTSKKEIFLYVFGLKKYTHLIFVTYCKV